MGLLPLIEEVGAAWSRWAGAHPVRAVLAVVAVVILSTVTVKRLELPVYKWVHHWARDWLNARLDGLGKRLMASLMKKVDEIAAEQKKLSERLEGHIGEAEQNWATEKRRHILGFSTGLSNGTAYDFEAFRQVMISIDEYEAYCQEHPEYPNSLATGAIQHIRDEFQHFLHND